MSIDVPHLLAYLRINSHLFCVISLTDGYVQTLGRIELDSHDNMLVFGSQCYFISHSSREATVNAFSDLVGSINSVPIVDVAVMYDCLTTQRTYILDAYALEMSNVSVAFEILPPGKLPPPGWTKSSSHLIWDVKMDFTRKY